MAETYGKLPTEIMAMNPQDFWLNARIHAATNQFKQDAQDQSATDQQVETLQAEADQRVDYADDLEGSQPSADSQRMALRQMEAQVTGGDD